MIGTKIAVRYTDEGDVWLGIGDEWFQFTMIEALTFAEYLHERLEEERNEEHNLPTAGLRIYIRIGSNTYSITLEAIRRIREWMLQGVRGSKPYRDFADKRLTYKEMKEPELQDFGITPKDYALYLGGQRRWDRHEVSIP